MAAPEREVAPARLPSAVDIQEPAKPAARIHVTQVDWVAFPASPKAAAGKPTFPVRVTSKAMMLGPLAEAPPQPWT